VSIISDLIGAGQPVTKVNFADQYSWMLFSALTGIYTRFRDDRRLLGNLLWEGTIDEKSYYDLVASMNNEYFDMARTYAKDTIRIAEEHGDMIDDELLDDYYGHVPQQTTEWVPASELHDRYEELGPGLEDPEGLAGDIMDKTGLDDIVWNPMEWQFPWDKIKLALIVGGIGIAAIVSVWLLLQLKAAKVGSQAPMKLIGAL